MSQVRQKVHFGLAVVVLVASATLIRVGTATGTLTLTKKASPIRKPLQDFDKRAMAPWAMSNVGRFSPESEEELGTKEYLNGGVVVPSNKTQVIRGIRIFVTYYTGVLDQVPHVPEECLNQAGSTEDDDDALIIHMPHVGQNVDVRRLSFYRPGELGQKACVYYTFGVNGQFMWDRQRVRVKMLDPFETHLYYSKVEVQIDAVSDAAWSDIDPIATDLLDKALAELVRSHWPLKGSERGAMVFPWRGETASGEQAYAERRRSAASEFVSI